MARRDNGSVPPGAVVSLRPRRTDLLIGVIAAERVGPIWALDNGSTRVGCRLRLHTLRVRVEPITLVLLEEAPPGLAYRIFRDGIPIAERDRAALVERKARAILEYLNFRPIEELFTRRVLDAAVHGR